MKTSSQSLSDEVGKYLSESRKCRSSARRGTVLVLEDESHGTTKVLDNLGSDGGFRFEVIRVTKEIEILKLLKGNKDVKAVVLHVGKVDISKNGSSLPMLIDEGFPDVPLWVVGKKPLGLSERVGSLQLDAPGEFHDVFGKSGACRSVSV